MNRYILFFMLVGLQANIASAWPNLEWLNPKRLFGLFKANETVQPAPILPTARETKKDVVDDFNRRFDRLVGNNLDEKPDSELNNNPNAHSPELKTTFEVIQDIHKLAARVKKDAKKRDIWIMLGKKGWPGANPYWGRTKQGLYLTTEAYPESLYTPWGQVTIFGSGRCDDMFFDEFRRNMKLKFVRNTCENSGTFAFVSGGRNGAKVKFYKENFQTPIAREDLEKYRETDTKIMANFCGCSSIYEIAKFGNIELPKAEPLEQKDFSDVKRVRKNWKEFMADYTQNAPKHE